MKLKSMKITYSHLGMMLQFSQCSCIEICFIFTLNAIYRFDIHYLFYQDQLGFGIFFIFTFPYTISIWSNIDIHFSVFRSFLKVFG